MENGQLDDADSKKLKESINEIVRDTPQTQIGASRFKNVIAKVGSTTGNAIRNILVDIVSETAKKIIWPNKMIYKA